MFDRLELLIGKENIEKISKINVLIVGIGGVGGTALEALVRSGVKNITIIDKDVFSESNLNRQILSTRDSIGLYKVDVGINRCKSINPDVNITGLKINLDEKNVNELEYFDFIIDACDDINAKLALMQYANKNNINLISSMGTGKRLNPSNVIITRLDKTSNDPLAKKMRYEARKRGLKLNIPVVCSKEEPINNDRIIASSIFVPSTAGLMLAYYIIEKVIND
ncbi:MAG: ThiF family adenylyltransferase [Firmicutes bacterium]|nr:ThiF family adenylyltransferase [Bacillota bacterium]